MRIRRGDEGFEMMEGRIWRIVSGEEEEKKEDCV